MKKTKHLFTLILRLVKNQEMDIDEALNELCLAYSNGKGFNYHNFVYGYIVGSVIALLIMELITKGII